MKNLGEIMTNMGRLIRSKRKQMGLTQRQLAHKLGYRQNGQYISNIERGICQMTPFQFRKLSTILKIRKIKLVDALIEDYRKRLENI